MSGEGAAEKVYEAGLEMVNPGGRPDVLRNAAKSWRDMGEHLDDTYRALNTRVEAALGEHWRGPAADAFAEHWKKIGGVVKETTPLFEKAADGLDEAAKNIEEINQQIHEIYIEIGVSIAASAALSFVTLGFSVAAEAANAARLGLEAANAASKLGKLLSLAARIFRNIRTFARVGKWQRLTVELGTQWAAGTGSGIATSLASGDGLELRENTVNGAVGALGGKLVGPAAGLLGGRAGAQFTAGAAVGGVSSVVGDTINNLWSGSKLDGSQMALGAVTGGLTGGAGSTAVHRGTESQGLSGAREFGGDVVTNVPFGVGLGVGGNWGKDLDQAVNGDPNADSADERRGESGNVREDAKGDAQRLQVNPDTAKYGAFG